MSTILKHCTEVHYVNSGKSWGGAMLPNLKPGGGGGGGGGRVAPPVPLLHMRMYTTANQVDGTCRAVYLC